MAKHVLTGLPAAVKILNPKRYQPTNLIDFDNEGLILERLNDCDGAVKLISRGEYVISSSKSGFPFDLSLPFQALVLADGSLSDLCDSPGARAKVLLLTKLQLWRSAILSLMRLHATGVAHRDIKADNCLVFTDNTGKPVVRYTDFGRGKDLSLMRSRPEEQYKFGRGDPTHAPPEAVFLQAGATSPDYVAADYYGVGSIFVELLTGLSMTEVSVGDIRGARAQAAYDLEHGQVRDLAVLSSKHDIIVESITNLLPKSIREDAQVLLATLCHPVSSERLRRGPFSRDQHDREPLTWVLRRIDIMIRRLKIDERDAKRQLERKV